MLDFETFIARHGEASAQAIVEGLERYESVPSSLGRPLIERWDALMKDFDRRSERWAA